MTSQTDEPDPESTPVRVVAVVKPFRVRAVLAALESVEILGGVVREAMGHGRQKNRLHQYLGGEYDASFLPKVELTIFVRKRHLAATLRAIADNARTGRIGDGKILVQHCLPEFWEW